MKVRMALFSLVALIGVSIRATEHQSVSPARRIIAPILAQLRQGITPEKIALTLALGAALGIFPILGASTLLCAIAGIWLRLNQPVIQLTNYLVYPLQL